VVVVVVVVIVVVVVFNKHNNNNNKQQLLLQLTELRRLNLAQFGRTKTTGWSKIMPNFGLLKIRGKVDNMSESRF